MPSPLLLVISENPRRSRALADLAGEHLPDWRLATAASVDAAQGHLEACDVVLLATSGLAAAAPAIRHLREQTFPLYIPILAVTEEGRGSAAEQKSLEAGVDDALAEPVPGDELAARIRILLTVSQVSRDLATVRRREAVYRQVIDQAAVGLCLVDQEAVITFASQPMADLAGHDAQHLVGKRIEDLLAEEYRRTFPQHLSRCRQGQMEVHELVLLGDDGRRRPLTALSHPVLDEAGRFAGCVVAWADLAGRDRREHQARLAERMDSVARLAGQLAHDFNNSLTIILGNAALLRRSLNNQPEAAGLVTEIIRAGEKAAALNRRLVAMGFGRLAAAAAVDVHELLEKIADEMRQSPDKPIRVDLELTAEASITQGDEEQLHTALLHLAQTLRDAMPYGGAMTIATRKVTLEPVDCQDRPVPIPPGDYLELTVADRSAVPVPAAVPAGPQHEAAELNLAGVFAAIRAHGGSIELNTPEGQGLACLLLLPLAAQG